MINEMFIFLPFGSIILSWGGVNAIFNLTKACNFGQLPLKIVSSMKKIKKMRANTNGFASLVLRLLNNHHLHRCCVII